MFYRQFALTMAMSIVLSGVVALTLTPVLCAMLLKPHTSGNQPTGPIEKLFSFIGGGITNASGRFAPALQFCLALVLGAAIGAGVYSVLKIELIAELAHEIFTLTESRVIGIAVLVAGDERRFPFALC